MEQLGLDFKTIAFQLVNFGILFVVLKKYLYGPITDLLERRIKTVKENENMRNSLSKDKDSLETKIDKLSSANKQKVEKLLKEAKREISQMKKASEKEAKTEAQRILSKAQDTASILKDRSSEKAKREMEKVAHAAAQEVFGDLLTKKQKDDYTKAAINRFLTK